MGDQCISFNCTGEKLEAAFEYARAALQLRVHDFLLKPIDEQELKKSIMKFLEKFHFDGERDMRIGLLIPQVHGEEDSESRNFRMQTIRQICLGMVDGQKKGITFTDEKGRIVISFFCDKDKKEEELSLQIVEILNDELEAKPRIIWGSAKKGIENISISYNDAVFVLEHERETFEKLYSMDLNRKREDIFQEVFREFRMAMIGSIGDREKMFHIFDRFGMAVDSYNLSAKYTRSCCFELASSVYLAYFTDTGSSADEFYVTPNYLSRLFKRVTGEGCNEYIVRKRIEKAKSLLAATTLKAGEIAIMVGYHDMNYFSLAFKKHAGVSPIKYREQAQGK